MAKRMGFQGQAFIGTAGSTAATRLDNSRDITYNLETEKGDTTVRGDSSVPPVGHESVTRRNVTITIVMINESTDTALETMRVAAYAGTPIALRLKDHTSGKGFDGDVTLTVSHGKPINGEQTLEFTATPENSLRTASLYV